MYAQGPAVTVNLATLQRVHLEDIQEQLVKTAFKFKYESPEDVFVTSTGERPLKTQLNEYGMHLRSVDP